ncbi:MAG: hypothetical protein ACFE7E_08150 [Candidatus Hodarchaeota archaeon]
MGRSRTLILALILIQGLWVFVLPGASAANRISSWATPVNISRTSSSVFTAIVERGLAVDPQGYIHAVFYGTQEIFYVNNTRGYWSIPYNVTQNDVLDQYPAIAIDAEGNIHLVYSGYDSNDMEIFYANKTARGWSIPVNLSKNVNSDRVVSIAIDSKGFVHIAWYGRDGSSTNDYEIFYTNNVQGYWISPLNVTSDTLAYAINPSIAIDPQDKIHIVWEGRDDSTFYDYEIFYANDVDESWVITNVTQNEIYDTSPSMDLDNSGNLHLAYQQYISVGEDLGAFNVLYVNRSVNGWAAPVNLSATRNLIGYLSLAADGENDVHIAFSQIEGSDFEVFYISRLGGIWGSPANVTRNDLNEIGPNLVIDEFGDAHIIYYRDTENDHNVFYVRSLRPSDLPILLIWIGVLVTGIACGAAIWLLRKRD